MGDYVSANGRSFPALLVMLEIDGIWQIQHHTLCTHARCRGWTGVFLDLLSRTSGVKDGDTKERRKQWTNAEEYMWMKEQKNNSPVLLVSPLMTGTTYYFSDYY